MCVDIEKCFDKIVGNLKKAVKSMIYLKVFFLFILYTPERVGIESILN